MDCNYCKIFPEIKTNLLSKFIWDMKKLIKQNYQDSVWNIRADYSNIKTHITNDTKNICECFGKLKCYQNITKVQENIVVPFNNTTAEQLEMIRS